MGEFNKDQGQDTQAGQQTDKPAFGQFDKQQGERGDQGQDEYSGADGGKAQTGQQNEFGQGQTGQQGGFDKGQTGTGQDDDQYSKDQFANEKGQGDDR